MYTSIIYSSDAGRITLIGILQFTRNVKNTINWRKNNDFVLLAQGVHRRENESLVIRATGVAVALLFFGHSLQ